MAYKNKKEYKEDKRKWSGRLRQRSPAGYNSFKMREAAWLQSQANKDNDKKEKSTSKSKPSGKANRSSGQYSDIQKAQQEDRTKGIKTAESFKNQRVKVGGISKEVQQQLDALRLANSNLNKQLASNSKSYENQLMQMGLQQQQSAAAYENQLANAQAGYQQQLQQMQVSNNAAMQQLETKNQSALQQMQSMMLSQQQQAANTQQLLESQLSSANTALTEQKRVSANLANAYVPQAEASADTFVYGDSREQKRKQRNNQLSDLSIVTGVGNAGNAGLAGLQLAG